MNAVNAEIYNYSIVHIFNYVSSLETKKYSGPHISTASYLIWKEMQQFLLPFMCYQTADGWTDGQYIPQYDQSENRCLKTLLVYKIVNCQKSPNMIYKFTATSYLQTEDTQLYFMMTISYWRKCLQLIEYIRPRFQVGFAYWIWKVHVHTLCWQLFLLMYVKWNIVEYKNAGSSRFRRYGRAYLSNRSEIALRQADDNFYRK